MQQRAEVLCVSQSKKGISEGASVDVIVVERRYMFPRYLLSIHCVPSLPHVVSNMF